MLEVMTKDQAITFGVREFWKDMTQEQIAYFQAHQAKHCIPLPVWREALEHTLGEKVNPPELIDPERVAEFRQQLSEKMGDQSLKELWSNIPEHKKILAPSVFCLEKK